MTAVLRARTVGLKRQHEAAPALIARYVTRIADMGELPSRADAYQVTLLLAKLAGMLRIHFAQEDSLLYPTLMASENGDVTKITRTFSDEISQIGPIFFDYSGRWRVTEAILGAPAAFARESHALFTALRNRIKREHDQLFPLADSLNEPEEEPAARVA